MGKTFLLEIVAPNKKFFEGNVEMIVINTSKGKMGVLKNHMPMMFAVTAGAIKITMDGKDRKAFVSDGFMEVKDNVVTLMVDVAEWPEEIDINRALIAKEKAREELQRQLSEKEFTKSQAALMRAMERLKITQKGM